MVRSCKMQILLCRSSEHCAHSCSCRRNQDSFFTPRVSEATLYNKVFQAVSAKDSQLSQPHVTLPVLGSQDPGFRVGSPCAKQYTSQLSFPYRSISITACNQGSSVLKGLVNVNVCWMESLSLVCQNILKIFCSGALYPLRNGLLKIEIFFTGVSCQKSPQKTTFKPPKALLCP